MAAGSVVALTLLVGIWIFPHVWFLIVKDKVDLTITFDPRYVSVGDTVHIYCSLRNRAWLPCPFVEISIQLPEGLSTSTEEDNHFIRFATHLQQREEMEVVATAYAVKRGYQQLQNYPVYVKVNEGFGLHILTLSRSHDSHMTVMPSFANEVSREPKHKALMGRIERFHWLQPDESLLRGIREYQPGDPFKYIAWQASASRGTWMVRQFSASTETTVCLLLNAQMFAEYWSGARHEEFNRLCEYVATYARDLQERGFQLTFASNAVLPNRPSQTLFGRESAASIRAMLGQLEPYASRDFLTLWTDYTAFAPSEETVIIFTSYEDERWYPALLAEEKNGRQIEIVYGPDAVRPEIGIRGVFLDGPQEFSGSTNSKERGIPL